MLIRVFVLFILLPAYTHAQHSLKKLDYPVNTDVYDEICPILSFDESELYFTRSSSPDFNRTLVENGVDLSKQLSDEAYMRKLAYIYSSIAGERQEPISSTFNQDVWYSRYDDGEIYNVIHPTAPLNNALPNSICSHYGTEGGYVIVNEFPKEGGVKAGFSVVTKKDNITYTYPEPIELQDFELEGSEINVCMSDDKQYIILSMVGPGTKGRKDLYLSVKVTDKLYGPPLLMEGINTRSNESTPHLSKDKKRLYFASDRPGGIGGMDIYVSDRLDLTYRNWSTPRLLGRPVNSPYDDSHPYVDGDDEDVLFTSNRDGSSDIFLAKLHRDPELDDDIVLNISIIDGATNAKAKNAQLYWGQAYASDLPHFFRVKGGNYTYTFTENVPMEFKAENRGAISEKVFLDPQELQDQDITEIELELVIEKNSGRTSSFKRKFISRDGKIKEIVQKTISRTEEEKPKRETDEFLPLEANSTVVLKNIYFARAKPDVMPASFPSLQKLAKTLIRRPDVVIRVEGHTDNVGGREALEKLSYRRAEAIVAYLQKEGVPARQLQTKGFGGTRPITNNRTEQERARNRRVEIRVLDQEKKR